MNIVRTVDVGMDNCIIVIHCLVQCNLVPQIYSLRPASPTHQKRQSVQVNMRLPIDFLSF